MENGLPFSTLYSRPDAFRHLPSSGALTCNCYRVVIGLLCAVVYIYIFNFAGFKKFLLTSTVVELDCVLLEGTIRFKKLTKLNVRIV